MIQTIIYRMILYDDQLLQDFYLTILIRYGWPSKAIELEHLALEKTAGKYANNQVD